MIKPTIFALSLIATPVHAECHHYKYWGFKFPQHCGWAYRPVVAQAKPVPDIPVAVMPPLSDQEEHDRAVRDHHDEINRLMKALKDSEVAAGQGSGE